jgi:hypothetical protein
MDRKLHIKAIAGRNIRVDAYLYQYGDEIDCYLTPAQFKDYVHGFLDFDIIMDEDSNQVSIDGEYTVVEEEKKEEVVENEQTLKSVSNEDKPVRKSTKKTN